MSRITTRIATVTIISLVGAIGLVQAQTPAQGEPVLTAKPTPMQDGPHPDRPKLEALKTCPDGWRPVPPGVNPALRCLPNRLVSTASGPERTSAVPLHCPEGWDPVSPELNPVLRCQPGRLMPLRQTRAAPEPPIGCPDGWKPVPPEVNRLLRCLPDNIAARATVDPGQAPPRGCPTGWKPVPPEVNQMMRCLPDKVLASGSPD